MSSTVLIPPFFDKTVEAREAVSQLGSQSLERTYQLFMTTFMEVCSPLSFA